jgi:hypothetical protein
MDNQPPLIDSTSVFASITNLGVVRYCYRKIHIKYIIKCSMEKGGVMHSPWSYKIDTYELFQYISANPRMRKKSISYLYNVNEKTGAKWWNQAMRRGIIRPPIFRRKSYLNFREYFYYLHVEDPHELYLELKEETDLMFISVQSGFSNFQVVSHQKLDLNDSDIVVSGARSDFYVTPPRRSSFSDSFSLIQAKLENIDSLKISPTPLMYHNEVYEWDELDEKIYREVFNDFRKSYRTILKNTGAYSKKILRWLRTCDQFGQTIVMYFPDGLGAYQPTTYLVETEYDSLLIDLFSCFPVSTVFFRLGKYLLFKVYLPFSLDGDPPYRSIPYTILNFLKKRKLVLNYTNSIDQYYYRPQF